MSGKRCSEYGEPQAAVLEMLEKVVAIVTAQLRAFQEGNQTNFAALDKALETAIGEKERRIGAMHQHAVDHKCQAFSE